MNRLVLLLCISLVLLSSGCVALPSIVKDERGLGTQYDDVAIKASIVSSLWTENPLKASSVNVYCYLGQVFLIGEADTGFRAFALRAAENAKGVEKVTTCWFPIGTSKGLNDTKLEMSIASKLLFAENVSSTQVAVDVYGGHVVLTGVVSSQAEIDRVVAVVRGVDGVRSVTSYLFPKPML